MGKVASHLFETLRAWTGLTGPTPDLAPPEPHLPALLAAPGLPAAPHEPDTAKPPHEPHIRNDRRGPPNRQARRAAGGPHVEPAAETLRELPPPIDEHALPVPAGWDPAEEQRQILAQQLSPTVRRWVAAYEEQGGRDLYLWQWCQHGLELIVLPCVLPELRSHLRDTKLLAVMLGVLLDDVADRGGAEHVLRELLAIVRQERRPQTDGWSEAEQTYARFTIDLWDAIGQRLQEYPCYAEHAALLDFDHWQIANTMQYAWLVNRRPALLNLAEHDLYLPHNMQMMSFVTMDLMGSPAFRREELGALREIAWHAQCMGRIGNLLSTWERELSDRDFTSAVFIRALRAGDVTSDDLDHADADRLAAAVRRGRHEDHFLQRWRRHREAIGGLVSAVRSFDVRELVRGLDRLIRMELLSRGLK
jgi:hypothetical protein